MKPKVYLLIKVLKVISFICSGVFSTFYSQAVTQKSQSDFIHDARHNPKMDPTIRKMLIEKGYHLLDLVQRGEHLPEKIEIFQNAGREFWTGRGSRRTLSLRNVKNAYQKLRYKDAKEKLALHTRQRQAKLENLIAIVWALADYCSRMSQPLERGSFSIIDSQDKLLNVFYHYVQFAANVKEIKKLSRGALASFNPLSSPFAYNRHPDQHGSSHYKGLTELQFGIDARFESNAYTLAVLPYKATHLLVGRVKTVTGFPKTFVKYESYGTGDIPSTLVHGLNFMNSGSGREKKRSEKDIPKSIMLTFLPLQSLLLTPQQYSNLELLKAGLSNFGTNNPSLTVSGGLLGKILKDVQAKRAGKDYDISSLALVAFLALKTSSDNGIKNAADTFLQTLESTYHDGGGLFAPNLSLNQFNPFNYKVFYRSGNEVVLDLAEVIQGRADHSLAAG